MRQLQGQTERDEFTNVYCFGKKQNSVQVDQRKTKQSHSIKRTTIVVTNEGLLVINVQL